MPTLNKVLYKDNVDYQSLLDMVYPVGSVCLFWNGINPIETWGGTWIKIEDALLAASGSLYKNADTIDGNKSITTSQMPTHSHSMSHTHNISHSHGTTAHSHVPANSAYNRFVIVQSNKTTRRRVASGTIGYSVVTDSNTDNSAIHSSITNSASPGTNSQSTTTSGNSSASNTSNTGNGSTFIPYHYNVNVWKRTA